MEQSDFDRIVYTVTEKVLLRMPEVIGNLIKEQSKLNSLRKKFYAENENFKEHPLIIQKILLQLESEAVDKDYEAILKEAVPLIRKQIRLSNEIKSKDMTLTSSNGVI